MVELPLGIVLTIVVVAFWAGFASGLNAEYDKQESRNA